MDIGVTETGKKALLEVPKSVKAGPVELSFENTGKKPHDVQLVRVAGDQTFEDVLKIVESDGAPTPKWLYLRRRDRIRAARQDGTTTAVLAPGRYFVADTESDAEGGRRARGDGRERERGAALDLRRDRDG